MQAASRRTAISAAPLCLSKTAVMKARHRYRNLLCRHSISAGLLRPSRERKCSASPGDNNISGLASKGFYNLVHIFNAIRKAALLNRHGR